MGDSLVVELAPEVRTALDEATRSAGVSADEIVERALKRYLFVRRFREAREETLESMAKAGLGDLTDEDVFRMVS